MKIDESTSRYFNILKGIAILSVVIGHCTDFAIKYVYSYHLALFFFISGFLYNEQKYGDDPFLNMANRIKKNYPKYVLYAAIIGIFHNFFVYIHIYNIDQNYWSFYDFRNYILNSIVMVNTEPLYGSTWFVLPLILASSIFGGIIYFSNYIKIISKSKYKIVVIILLSIICCALGYERMKIKFTLPMRLDVSLFVIPLFTIAYFIKLYKKDFERLLNPYIAIVLFIVTIYLTYKANWFVSLVDQNVNIIKFYILAIVGIYQCMYMAKLINDKLKFFSNFFEFIGTYSFEIMSFHFICFKIIDVIYSYIFNINNIALIESFPYSYKNLWYIYIVFACLAPAIMTKFTKRLFRKLKKYLIDILI